MENQKSKFSLNLPALFGIKNAAAAADEKQPWSGKSILRKVALVLLSLLAAMLLWGYVLMSQNPDRTKIYTGVPVKLESGSEADLLYKNLMIYGNIADILQDVTVTVSAPMKDITKLTASDINATVNFNDVHGAGVTRLEVRATSSSGTVVNIDPAYIDVEVDEIISRSIAVDSELVGELPEGYWHGGANITPKSVTVKGARRDVEAISSAICPIDLSELTSSVNRSVTLQLANETGEIVDNAVLIESVPSVNLQMQVLPYKEVTVDYNIVNELPDGLQIASVQPGIESLTIACEQSTLDTLDSITTEKIFVGETSPGVYSYSVALTGIPDDAVVLDNSNIRTARVVIVVAESVEERTFEGVTIRLTGSSNSLLYTYYLQDESGELGEPLVRLAVDVTVRGPASIVDEIKASDISLLLDVTGLGPGGHNVPLQLLWNSMLGDLDEIEYPAVIHVEIEQP